jgi:hypothetical protein
VCSDLETYKNFLINLEYYMISSIRLTVVEFSRICIVFMWGNVISTFTDTTNGFEVNINENGTVAKVTVTIVVFKKIFKNEINRIKKMFYDRKIMITVNDDVTNEIIYVKRTRELPSELKNNSVKLRRIFLNTYGHDFEYHLSENQCNISTKTAKTFYSDVTIEVSRMVDDTLFVQSNHYNDEVAMTISSSSSVLSILSYMCFSTSIVALIGLLISRSHFYLQTYCLCSAQEHPLYGKCVTLSELFFITSCCLYSPS